MNLEIVHPRALVKVLSDAKKLLMNENDFENRSVCYPWFLIEKWPEEVFQNITYIHTDINKIEPLQAKGKQCICEPYAEHKQQYDLVIELRSKWKPKEIMQLVKPGWYIISEENFWFPYALETSNQFVFIQNLSKHSKEKPIHYSGWVFGNWKSDLFLYKKLDEGKTKALTTFQRLSKTLLWNND